jgi:nitrate/nitrite transport system ATP-binding protein
MKQRQFLALEDISVEFATKKGIFTAIRDINLSINEGEYVALIGHSGCGKSTLLNVIAGLTKAARGVVFLDGGVVDKPGVDRAVVFQDHSLLPWLSVYQNVALAVDKVFGSSKSKTERHEWVLHNLALVNMTHAKDKRPAEISGGMKQRVGIARAIAMQPRVLLLDEPFGALDALTRATLQDTVMDIQTKLKQTVVMITHDVDEAVLLADRVVMMTNGPAATIGEDLPVKLPRPRRRLELAENQQYIEARKAILSFLYDRFAHPAEAA